MKTKQKPAIAQNGHLLLDGKWYAPIPQAELSQEAEHVLRRLKEIPRDKGVSISDQTVTIFGETPWPHGLQSTELRAVTDLFFEFCRA